MWNISPKSEVTPQQSRARGRGAAPAMKALGPSGARRRHNGALQSERCQTLASEDNGIIGSSLEGSALIISSIYYMNLTQYLLQERSLGYNCFLAGDSSYYQGMIHSLSSRGVPSQSRRAKSQIFKSTLENHLGSCHIGEGCSKVHRARFSSLPDKSLLIEQSPRRRPGFKDRSLRRVRLYTPESRSSYHGARGVCDSLRDRQTLVPQHLLRRRSVGRRLCLNWCIVVPPPPSVLVFLA